MSMRLDVVKAKDTIAAGENGVADMSPEAVNIQLEKLHDAMIDIHKNFVESPECCESYVDFFNTIHDDSYVSENKGKGLFATLKEAYRNPRSGDIILTMLTKVWVKNISKTGFVTFAPMDKPQANHRLYADEMRNYRYE